MGGCCSCHVSIVGKVHDVESECSQKGRAICEHGGGRVMLEGSSKFVSMYSQKGTKGVNQDALTVWEVRFFMYWFAGFISFSLFNSINFVLVFGFWMK